MMKILKAIIILFFLSGKVLAIQLSSTKYGPETIPDIQLHVGDLAPQVTLFNRHYKQVTIGGSSQKLQIILTVDSLYTTASNHQIMMLNADVNTLMKQTVIYVVTTNQPIIVNMFEKTHKLGNVQILSAFNNADFGLSYGIQIIGGHLTGTTAPAVFVVNPQGKIIYKQIANNTDKLLNIQAAITAAANAEKKIP